MQISDTLKEISETLKQSNDKTFKQFYAAALTGVCMNPILCAQAIENSRSPIVSQQTDMHKALAATAYKLATAAMQKLENESKDGF